MNKTAPRVLTCNEVDRLYRLRHGTARAAVKARKIRSKPRGRRIYISAEHAERLWGIP